MTWRRAYPGVVSLLLVGCSAPCDQRRGEQERSTAPTLLPSPGADIDPKILEQLDQRPALTAATRGGMVADLGADRPVLKIDVPGVGRATTASFTFGDGRQGWITRLPTGTVMPSVAYGKGRIYVSGGFDTYAFYALDARSGKMLWNRQDLQDNGPTAPSYLDEELIFNTESCTLFVLDAGTGRTRWSRWLGDPTLAQPAVEHGLVFASYPKNGGQRLGAFRLKNGRPVWSRSVSGELLTAPVVSADSVYATTIHGHLYRFGARTGARRWVRRLGATSAPWIAGQRVFVNLARTERGQPHELLATLDVATGRTLGVVRRVPVPSLADVPRDLRSWPRVWAFEGSRPLMSHGRLVDTIASMVSATNPDSGDILWQRRDQRESRGRSLTPPVVAGSQIIFASRRGEVYALDMDTGMTVWAYALDRKIASSPTVAKGWVYLPTADGSVVALHAGDSGLDGWHMWGGGPAHNG